MTSLRSLALLNDENSLTSTQTLSNAKGLASASINKARSTTASASTASQPLKRLTGLSQRNTNNTTAQALKSSTVLQTQSKQRRALVDITNKPTQQQQQQHSKVTVKPLNATINLTQPVKKTNISKSVAVVEERVVQQARMDLLHVDEDEIECLYGRPASEQRDAAYVDTDVDSSLRKLDIETITKSVKSLKKQQMDVPIQVEPCLIDEHFAMAEEFMSVDSDALTAAAAAGVVVGEVDLTDCDFDVDSIELE